MLSPGQAPLKSEDKHCPISSVDHEMSENKSKVSLLFLLFAISNGVASAAPVPEVQVEIVPSRSYSYTIK